MKKEIGSMWSRWDLHIHSPFSILNHGDFGNGFDNSNRERFVNKYIHDLFSKAIIENISVIGITDYYLIDGYKEVKNILDDRARLSMIFSSEISSNPKYLEYIKEIVILPNIEFRLELGISEKTPDGLKNSKYQIHVIFSDDVEIQKIEDNFLHRLEYITFVYDGKQDKYTITKENFENYGKNLIAKGIGGNGSPLFVGMNNAYVNISDVLKYLDSPEFINKHIIVLSEEDQSKQNWNDQLAGIRLNLFNSCHAIFSSNENTIRWGIDGRSNAILDKQMPCLWGSDAHNYSDLFKPSLNRFTWIKANPSFEGLQLALKNPTNRINIGETCKELEALKTRSNFTFGIVKVDLIDKTRRTKIWFDIDLMLNPFLVTIIGNKGSGKSALSDILGYLGNSFNAKYFSFLSNDRFLSKKTKYGDYYRAELGFCNGKEKINKNTLTNLVDQTNSEIVKYLPQKYIEEICNDLGDTFQEEIDKTIFSYVSPQEKGDSTNLSNLISLKTKSNYNKLFEIRSQLEGINIEIRNLEERSTAIYRQEIENKLKNLKLQLKSHIDNKPLEVKKPSEEHKHKNSEIIEKISCQRDEIEKTISIVISEVSDLNEKITVIEDFKTLSLELTSNIEQINEKYHELSGLLGLVSKDYIKINYINDDLDQKYDLFIRTKIEKSKLLNDTNHSLGLNTLPEVPTSEINIERYLDNYPSLYDKKDILELYMQRLLKDVSIDEQRYIEYQVKLKIWDQTLQMIEGSIPNTIDGESVKKYEKELEYLTSGLQNNLDTLMKQRIDVIANVYNEYEKIIDKYVTIYSPIQEKINFIMKSEIEKIEFKALLKVNKGNLKDKILSFIDTRAGGDFKRQSEANKIVDDLISSTDFNNQNSTIEFVNELLTKLTDDPNEIKKKLSNPNEFYNFITKLEYLGPTFSIISGDRELSELSPGERGIVLLIFYLALSKENIPLIIDQPEDNLDNQSVFSRLVPAIVEAKRNRQVIVVTHNPNIAIACDSEQVIFCSMDKETGELKYVSGGIEDSSMKRHILDILEGTKPAFDKRKTTYN